MTPAACVQIFNFLVGLLFRCGLQLCKIGRVSSVVILKITAFSVQKAQNTLNPIVFYDTSSTYQANGKLFDRGPACSTD